MKLLLLVLRWTWVYKFINRKRKSQENKNCSAFTYSLSLCIYTTNFCGKSSGGHIKMVFCLWTGSHRMYSRHLRSVTVLICGNNSVCMRRSRANPDPFIYVPQILISIFNFAFHTYEFRTDQNCGGSQSEITCSFPERCMIIIFLLI